MAAKRTGDLIPLCHPLPLSLVEVELTIVESGVEIVASAETTAQTGVEMEALVATSIAALTLYDMAKAIDKKMVVSGRARREDEVPPVRAAVLTVSDGVVAGTREDASGDLLARLLEADGYEVERRVVADETAGIVAALEDLGERATLVLTGGTGVAPRDITPEATARCSTVRRRGSPRRSAPTRSHPKTPTPCSRAGIAGGTLVSSLPVHRSGCLRLRRAPARSPMRSSCSPAPTAPTGKHELVARPRLAPVGETMFPPRAPFSPDGGGTSRFPHAPPRAHRPGGDR